MNGICFHFPGTLGHLSKSFPGTLNRPAESFPALCVAFQFVFFDLKSVKHPSAKSAAELVNLEDSFGHTFFGKVKIEIQVQE
jgi:hypothetical protein